MVPMFQNTVYVCIPLRSQQRTIFQKLRQRSVTWIQFSDCLSGHFEILGSSDHESHCRSEKNGISFKHVRRIHTHFLKPYNYGIMCSWTARAKVWNVLYHITCLVPFQINYTVNVRNPNTFRFRTGPHLSVVNLFEQPNNAEIRTKRSDFRPKFMFEIRRMPFER